MKNTTTPFLLIAFFATVFNFLSINCDAQDTERIRIIFGTRSHPNSDGKGCEGDKGTCLIFAMQDRVALDNEGVAEITVKQNRVYWNIIEDSSPAESNENTFYVYEEKILPAELVKELGYEQIVIQPGKYYLDKSRNPLGCVILEAEIK